MRPFRFRLRTFMVMVVGIAVEMALYVVFLRNGPHGGTDSPDYYAAAVLLLLTNGFIALPFGLIGLILVIGVIELVLDLLDRTRSRPGSTPETGSSADEVNETDRIP